MKNQMKRVFSMLESPDTDDDILFAGDNTRVAQAVTRAMMSVSRNGPSEVTLTFDILELKRDGVLELYNDATYSRRADQRMDEICSAITAVNQGRQVTIKNVNVDREVNITLRRDKVAEFIKGEAHRSTQFLVDLLIRGALRSIHPADMNYPMFDDDNDAMFESFQRSFERHMDGFPNDEHTEDLENAKEQVRKIVMAIRGDFIANLSKHRFSGQDNIAAFAGCISKGHAEVLRFGPLLNGNTSELRMWFGVTLSTPDAWSGFIPGLIYIDLPQHRDLVDILSANPNPYRELWTMCITFPPDDYDYDEDWRWAHRVPWPYSHMELVKISNGALATMTENGHISVERADAKLQCIDTVTVEIAQE